MMTSNNIRKTFLEYFKRKGHTIVPSSGLIPEGDPTLLFTNAGMVQFKRVFLGEEKRPYKTAASAQKCIRAGGKHNDLENVGHTSRHHTFFEMLGNFSFGDYFKADAIELAWEFLTRELKLPVDKLWVTVFEEDDEAEKIWREKIGVRPERIKRMGEKDNFWSMGDTGPCGPCSEIIIDQGEETGCGKPSCAVGCDCDRFLELWNLVFMQYNRDSKNKISPLPRPSIDTGMGLERITAVVQGKKSNYDTDLFMPIIKEVEELSGVKYGKLGASDASIRAIADHSRAVAFLLSEGLSPSNEGRGYVLRRIIRRAARHGRFIGIKEPFLHKTVAKAAAIMGDTYPELVKAKDFMIKAAKSEEERFSETLERGLTILEDELNTLKKEKKKVIPGSFAFKLYDTYGFPLDLTADIVRAEDFTVDEDGFTSEMEIQKDRARKSWKGIGETEEGAEFYRKLKSAGLKSDFVGYHLDVASSNVACILKDFSPIDSAQKGDKVEIVTVETPFYGESGGQTGDTGFMVGPNTTIRVIGTQKPMDNLIVHNCVVEEGAVATGDTLELTPDIEKRKKTRRNHTATHILHSVLRTTLGAHVRQAGSLVTPVGLRFDFNHFAPLTDEEIYAMEAKINAIIRENIPVSTEVLSYEKAVEKGALAFFGEKYGGTVRMVKIEGVSKELCGGTHVKMTGGIGLVKISSESSVAAGVRRIEAVTGEEAFKAFKEPERILKESAELLKVSQRDLLSRIKKLVEYQKELEKELTGLKKTEKAGLAEVLLLSARKVSGINVLAANAGNEGPEELRSLADTLKGKLKSAVIVLGSSYDGKAVILSAVTKDLSERLSAGEIVKRLAPIIGGKGGGKPDMAQAGGKLFEKLDDAIKEAAAVIEEMAKSTEG